MPYPHYKRFQSEQTDWRSNTTQPFNFAILDPPPEIEPEIDWVQVEEQAQIRLDVWSRLLGFYTCKVKRQQEIIEHAQFMQHAEIGQKIDSVNQFLKENQYE